jgi:N-acetylglucosaminyldiphosphoundecaprenol N-acetyl-beta-D-mannosaminyltransferase
MRVGNRVRVGSLRLDPLTMSEAINSIRQAAQSDQPGQRIVVTANAQFAQIARANKRFYDILDRADMVVADGMSVVAASRLLGRPLPERIAGVDLVEELCREAACTGMTVYFLGGKPGAAEKAAANLRAEFPKLKIAGIDCPPMGFETQHDCSALVLSRIVAAAPDILFVGLGAPKQKFWMQEHRSSLPVKVMIGVGGTFELLAGDKSRAPLWIQRIGLEWLYRLLQEPRRLWRRYLIGNAEFIQVVLWQILRQRRQT